MSGRTSDDKLKTYGSKFNNADITLHAFNNWNIAGFMDCSTSFSELSEFRVYRNNTDNTEWSLFKNELL